MADNHSFSSYIHNSWSFDSYINNTESFLSYIKNEHVFGVYPLYEPATPSELFWFAKFINRCFMSIQNVLSTSNLTLDITIPEILSLLNSNLITIRQTIEGAVTITINPPTISAIMSSLQSPVTDILLPFNITASISQSIQPSTVMSVPSVQITATLSACQYYMLNYYDTFLLSELDSEVLSELDADCS